jgi:hypothetical protein
MSANSYNMSNESPASSRSISPTGKVPIPGSFSPPVLPVPLHIPTPYAPPFPSPTPSYIQLGVNQATAAAIAAQTVQPIPAPASSGTTQSVPTP